MKSKDINDEISRCIIGMLISEPFYAHFLSGIVRNVTTEIPTAAVGLNNTKVTLYINENFFLNELIKKKIFIYIESNFCIIEANCCGRNFSCYISYNST